MTDQPSPTPHPNIPPDGPPDRPSRAVSPLTWVLSLALAAMVGALLFVGGYLAAGSSGTSSCAAPSEAFVAFCDAYRKLQDQYVDRLDDDKLAEGAIQGMFEFGVEDPFSGYMPPDQYRSALDDLSGRFSGIGAVMEIANLEDPEAVGECRRFSDVCALVVVSPLEGSPAEEAGLMSGDVVLAVDGESVEGSTLGEQVARVRGPAGTDVTLTLERDGSVLDLTITRAEIVDREVTSRMLEDGETGYIALHNFSEPGADQFEQSLASLLEEGATGIVFDLRNNPGGYIEAARKVASQFVDDGLLFSQESAGDDVRDWEATGDGVATASDLPVVVLVNGGSASASEIVAAALKETKRATLVGQPTYGKNSVQIWAELQNGGGVRITISRWFTPEHNSVAPDGVQPDVVVEVPDGTPPDRDLYLERALEVLTDRGVGDPASPAADIGETSRLPGRIAPGWAPVSYDAGGRTTAAA